MGSMVTRHPFDTRCSADGARFAPAGTTLAPSSSLNATVLVGLLLGIITTGCGPPF
jgi:hypothetical protein